MKTLLPRTDTHPHFVDNYARVPIPVFERWQVHLTVRVCTLIRVYASVRMCVCVHLLPNSSILRAVIGMLGWKVFRDRTIKASRALGFDRRVSPEEGSHSSAYTRVHSHPHTYTHHGVRQLCRCPRRRSRRHRRGSGKWCYEYSRGPFFLDGKVE